MDFVRGGENAMEGRTVDILAPWNHLSQENVVVGFVDTLLRGSGQVMFQNNPITGLFFLAGIFYNSYQFGIAALIGLLASTIAAMLLGADRNLIRAGLFGYNGILTGIGLAFFLQLNWSAALIVYIILGGVVSTIVFIALANVFSTWDKPALTAPFVLTTWLFLLAVPLAAHLPAGSLIAPALPKPNAAIQTLLRPSPTDTIGGGVTAVNVVQSILRGIGEVFFQNNLVTGILFLVGILINSRVSALFAALGSIVGMIIGLYLLGVDGNSVYAGLYGFNAVLCGIAVGGIFYVLDWKSGIYALLCALVGTVVMAALTTFLAPVGMPALTAPFVLTTWLFLLPKAAFHSLQPVPLAEVDSPEHILHAQRERQHAAGPELAK
jgi:urea transporter